MSQERLTRQELSWLLAQEARGAARVLREGVTQLKQPGPGITIKDEPAVETTLDALDDAISKLSELQTGTPGKGGARRGRIDLAALLYEIAPAARISIEPGAGTEVFGEEADLRRMLHVLLSQTHSDPALGSASPDIEIRRQDQWVRISVELGPDTSANLELERRWLSRMAVRHGGRLELEGGTQSILLPADGASDQREVVELRKELVEAQQLGEAYARELAAVFAAGDMPVERSEPPGPDVASERLDALVSAATCMAREVRELVDGMRSDATTASETLGETSELAKRLARRTATAAERTVELMRIAECTPADAVATLDVDKLVHAAASDAEARALPARRRARVAVEATSGFAAPRAVLDLGRALADRPRHRRHAARRQSGDPRGATQRRRWSCRSRTADRWCRKRPGKTCSGTGSIPTGLGRPGGLTLLAADAAVGALGGRLAMRESERGRSEIRAVIPL